MPTMLGIGGKEPGKANKLCQGPLIAINQREFKVYLREAPSFKRAVSGDIVINTIYSEKIKNGIKDF